MIHMPHRSVTRFFVPLIDVLLLLFVIFLLMPFANEEDIDKQLENASNMQDEATRANAELDRTNDTLKELQKDRETVIKDVEELRDLRIKNEALRKLVNQSPQEQYVFHMIDIDRETGNIYTLDSQGGKNDIKDAADAKKLMRRDRAAADENPLTRGKRINYCFIYPRPTEGRPTTKQLEKYREWFTDLDLKTDTSVLKGAPP